MALIPFPPLSLGFQLLEHGHLPEHPRVLPEQAGLPSEVHEWHMTTGHCFVCLFVVFACSFSGRNPTTARVTR